MRPYTDKDVAQILTRVGLYIRVSTEEQAMRGYSLEAQEADLKAYAERHGYKIAGTYIDAGKSASKKPLKREALQTLLKDVEAGKIDLILFIKLDRWSRNMSDYCDMERVLRKHGVNWKTTQEEYDTTTPNGRFAIHIMVAKAENEAAVTSERIKFVLNNKRKNGEACFGGSHKINGYLKKKGEDGKTRLDFDPEEYDMISDFFKYCKQYNSALKAGTLVNEEYDVSYSYWRWLKIFNSEFCRGMHKGVENFCPAYISQEDWEKIKKGPKTRKAEKDRVYLFTGLIKCPECGSAMRSNYKSYKGKEWYSYKCRNHMMNLCPMNKHFAELKTEKWLLKNIEELLSQYIVETELSKGKPKKKPKKDPLQVAQEKLRRLNVIYMAGGKTDEEYVQEAAELNEEIRKAQAEKCEDAPKDLSKLKEFFDSNFTLTYNSLSREEKARLWRSIISNIHFKGNDPVGVEFKH